MRWSRLSDELVREYACEESSPARSIRWMNLCYRIRMTMVVDIRHWLDGHGQPHPALRRRVLWIARLIEYGGPLQPDNLRETLVECTSRPGRKPCLGLVWVEKLPDGRIEAFCMLCEKTLAVISGWEETEWAGGPMEPVSEQDLEPLH